MSKQERIRWLVIENDDARYAALIDRLDVIRRAQFEFIRAHALPEDGSLADDASIDAALIDARSQGADAPIARIFGGSKAPLPCVLIADPARKSGRGAAPEENDSQGETAGALRAQILAIVGHELKSPIASLRGYCDFLLENAASELVRDAASKMRGISRHLEHYVANLCEFVRLDSGDAALKPRLFSFEALVQEVVDLFMPYARHKGIFLTYDVQSRTPDLILGDDMRIRQVLLNLVKNAITHTDGGIVDITASVSPRKLRVSVRDDGFGMDEDLVRAILSETGRPPAPNRDYGGGLGLGLTICRRLINLMGGRLLLESTPGFGTIAGFELPLEKSVAPAPAEKAEDSPYWE